MVVRGRSTSSVMTSNVPNGERHIPASVRSFPERSGANLRLSNHLGAHMRHV